MAYKYKALDLPYSEQAEFTNYASNYNGFYTRFNRIFAC